MSSRAYWARRVLAMVWAVVLALLASAAAAEPQSVPIEFKQGLPHLRIGVTACASQPEMEVVLDTGASATMIPYRCLKELEREGAAVEVEGRSVVLADGSEQRVAGYFISGLKLGQCEIPAVRVVCCKDPALAFPPVLGMDILQRLPNVTLRLAPGGATLSFDCPAAPPAVDRCGDDDARAAYGEPAPQYALRPLPTPPAPPCPGR